MLGFYKLDPVGILSVGPCWDLNSLTLLGYYELVSVRVLRAYKLQDPVGKCVAVVLLTDHGL